MTSRSQPPGEVEVDAHSLIRLRERTEYPQLTDVPSDLRVNGARHASRESLPPSKPCRPQTRCSARRRAERRGVAPRQGEANTPILARPALAASKPAARCAEMSELEGVAAAYDPRRPIAQRPWPIAIAQSP